MAAIDLLVFLLHAGGLERGVLLLMHKVVANNFFEYIRSYIRRYISVIRLVVLGYFYCLPSVFHERDQRRWGLAPPVHRHSDVSLPHQPSP